MWHTQIHTGRLPGQAPRVLPPRKPKAEEPRRSVGRPKATRKITTQGKWFSEITHAVGAWPAIGLMIGE